MCHRTTSAALCSLHHAGWQCARRFLTLLSLFLCASMPSPLGFYHERQTEVFAAPGRDVWEPSVPVPAGPMRMEAEFGKGNSHIPSCPWHDESPVSTSRGLWSCLRGLSPGTVYMQGLYAGERRMNPKSLGFERSALRKTACRTHRQPLTHRSAMPEPRGRAASVLLCSHWVALWHLSGESILSFITRASILTALQSRRHRAGPHCAGCGGSRDQREEFASRKASPTIY